MPRWWREPAEMAAGQLKIKAFEVILTHLLGKVPTR